MSLFAQRLIDWHRQHGRHDLPWQGTADPYRVWLSEIMLQQTQVSTVIPYYRRFLDRFPTLSALADAPIDEVMAYWSGLGYYARARNLHRCARVIAEQCQGRFPQRPEALAELPGIGRSTANAIAVFCFGARAPILDGNVKRLLCRSFGIDGFPGSALVERRLWQEAEKLLPRHDVATYIQAQMDIGATVCTRSKPHCERCPVADLCIARRENRIRALPTPRPRRILPEKGITVLIIRSPGHVLLEQRPPSGIWSGLLSLPELPTGEEPADYAARALGIRIDAVLPVPSFFHGFTHFRLEIQPLACHVPRRQKPRGDTLRWISNNELAQAALPAPIRTLLASVIP